MLDSIIRAYQFLLLGGPVMPFIMISSIACLAIIIERFWSLRQQAVLPKRLIQQLKDLLQEKKFSEARALCGMSEATVARILSQVVSKAGSPKAEVKEILENAGRRETTMLERRLDFLGTLATAGPLLGLLGTVIGMIRTFMVVRTSGVGDPMKLSGGIAEALICTAAGLVVAIPALLFHRYFLHKVDQYVLGLEEFSEMALNELQGGS